MKLMPSILALSLSGIVLPAAGAGHQNFGNEHGQKASPSLDTSGGNKPWSEPYYYSPREYILRYGLISLVLLAISACDSGTHAVEEATSDIPCESLLLQVASGVDASVSRTDDVTCLAFGAVAPMAGALAISNDGHTAAHIGTDNDVVVWNTADFRVLETIPSDGIQPNSVALSSDGNLLAIGYFDSRLVVRSRRENKILREFKGHTGGVSVLAFSLDGQMLASGGDDATSQIWEVSTGRQLRVFDLQFFPPKNHSDYAGFVTSLGFSGNGRALVVNELYNVYEEHRIRRGTTLWDIEKGFEISTRDVAPSDGSIRSAQALGGRGWLLAYTGREGLLVERLDSCESPRELPSGRYADTVSADPQGRWVAVEVEGKLKFFGMNEDTQDKDTQDEDTQDGDTQDYSITLPSYVMALVAHPDGHSIFALTPKKIQLNKNEVVTGNIYRLSVPSELWNLPALVVKEDATHCPPEELIRLQQDFKFPEKSSELAIIAKLNPTKEMLADLPNPEGESRIALKAISETEKEELIADLRKYEQINYARELYFDQAGSLYALYRHGSTYYNAGGVAVWSLQTEQFLRSWSNHSYVGDFTFRLKEGWGNVTQTANNLITGKVFFKTMGDEYPDSRTVTSDRDTGEVYRKMVGHFERYDPSGKRLEDVPTSGTVTMFSARNGRLAALYSDGKVQVWPLQEGGASVSFMLPLSETETVSGEAGVLELSADGNFVQIPRDKGSNEAKDYQIYSLHSAKLVAHGPLLTPFLGRSSLGVVQDVRAHHLAVWDFDKGAIIARLPRHPSRDKNGAYKTLLASMSDDGRFLASASNDGLVRVWDLNTRQVIGEANLNQDVMKASSGGSMPQKAVRENEDNVGAVTAMAFDSDGGKLAVGKWDGQLIVLQIPNAKKKAWGLDL